uniref:Simk1 n=1 Tax=Arundo donax TaxID=35708 RepID=A0A0A9B797_ARUDO
MSTQIYAGLSNCLQNYKLRYTRIQKLFRLAGFKEKLLRHNKPRPFAQQAA